MGRGKGEEEGGGVREGEDATRRRMECRTEAYIDTLPAGQADLQLISIVLYSNVPLTAACKWIQ